MSEETPGMNHSEPAEPKAGATQMPVGIMVALILVGYLGCNKVDTLNADFAANVHAPFSDPTEVASLAPSAKELLITRGKGLYANCNGCHGPTGTGTAGKIPPLAGSEWVVGDADTMVAIILNGLSGPIKVLGNDFGAEAMTPFGGTLSDSDVAAVATYVRNAWGNAADPVSTEDVARVRAKIKQSGHTGNWSADSLQAQEFLLPQQ